ncbi:MAG: hypothetical protein COB24_13735 [Hyphomicrobiales bacterium]|nr:MAG: hypothetical protein COB24_13735 [Hyphomicrobiales bacterium]
MMKRAFSPLIIELECILAIKLIIFDFDGVLVDSEFIAGQVMTKQLNELGIKTNLATILQLFVGLDDIAKRLLLVDIIGTSEVEVFILETKRLSRMAYMKRLKPLPFVESMLENLSIAKCIASNSHPDSLKVKVKASKLDRFFRKISFILAQWLPSQNLRLTFIYTPQKCTELMQMNVWLLRIVCMVFVLR